MACWNCFLGAVLSFWTILGSIHAFPDGAPESACENMLPVHTGVQAQTIPSPYEVSVSTPSFQNGQLVNVQILGAAYRGLLLEARSFHPAAALGFWQTPPNDTRFLQSCRPHDHGDVFEQRWYLACLTSGQHVVGQDPNPTCSGNPQGAITHSNTNLKMSQIYSWLPPPLHCPPVVYFVATVAQSHDIYWTKVKSKVIWRNPQATCGVETSGRQFSAATGIACLLLMILHI